MENELKARSIRLDSEIFDKFRAISEEFPNQAQTLSALISAYEVEKSKAILPERQTEIENFSMYIQKLNDIYNHSLMLNHDAENRIRAEFNRQLTSKDDTIADLRVEINKLREQSKDIAEFKAEKTKTEKEYTQQIQRLEKDSEKNEKVINSQHEQIQMLSDKLKQEESTAAIGKEYIEINQQLNKKIEKLESEMQKLKQESELEIHKLIFEQKVKITEEYDLKIANQRNEHKKEIERLQDLYQNNILKFLDITKAKQSEKKPSTRKTKTKENTTENTN